jgi:hypothetical protein
LLTHIRAQSEALNTHHLIKVLALVIMTVDHLGAFIWPDYLWLRAIGRITVPVWFFLVGHARHHRTSFDLVIWAVVLVVLSPLLGMPLFPLNVLVTMILCQALLRQVERHQLFERQPVVLILAIILFLLPTYLLSEYGALGYLYALIGYAIQKGYRKRMSTKILTIIALVAFLGAQVPIFPFSPAQWIFVVVGTTLVTLYLYYFAHKPTDFAHKAPAFRGLVVTLSRSSLQYYAAHRVVLQAIGVLIGALPVGFRWL